MLELIKNRRSIRWFNNKPISRDDLLELVEAGIYAPSGANSQNQRFIIIQDKKEIMEIGKVRFSFPYKSKVVREKHTSGLIGHATALIVVCVDKRSHVLNKKQEAPIWRDMWFQNSAASIQNIPLLAASKGIGSCWISALPKMDGTRLLKGSTWYDLFSKYGLTSNHEVHGIVILGYTDKINSLGYPKGETKHQDKNIERKHIDEYMLGAKI